MLLFQPVKRAADILCHHALLGFLDQETFTGLQVRRENAQTLEEELLVANLVGGAGGDAAFASALAGDEIEGGDGDIAHEQDDLQVGKLGDLGLEGGEVFFDQLTRHAHARTRFPNGNGEVDPQGGDISDATNGEAGLLESAEGVLHVERSGGRVEIVGRVFGHGFGDHQDGNFLWSDLFKFCLVKHGLKILLVKKRDLNHSSSWIFAKIVA